MDFFTKPTLREILQSLLSFRMTASPLTPSFSPCLPAGRHRGEGKGEGKLQVSFLRK